jgi:hypothetical protein
MMTDDTIKDSLVKILDYDPELEFHPLHTAHHAIAEQVADSLLPHISVLVNTAYMEGYGVGSMDERDRIADALDEKGKNCRIYGAPSEEPGYRVAAIDVRAGLGAEHLLDTEREGVLD